MGFFQDLKEDLSIAANELAADAQGGENTQAAAEQPEAAVEAPQAEVKEETPAPAKEPKADELVMPEDDMDVMPSAELAKALVEADVVEKQEEKPAEQPKDAISPDGKPAPVFGEQMELQLGGYQEAPAAAAPAEEAPKAEQKKNTKDDTIEKAANELKSIADMMNVKKEDKKEDKKEKKMEEVKETVTENTAAQAPDNADGNSAAYGAASALEGEPMDENAVITACMTVKGDVQSRGSVEIQGVVEGNVTVLGKLNVSGKLNGDAKAAEVFADGAQISGQINADGTAKIGKESVIIGNIYATSAVIAGAVKGDIDVHGPVILDSTAIVMGNIKSKSVQINNGAAIEGMCSQCYADSSPSSFFDKFLK